MWMNLGLFLLVWECIAVLVMTSLRLVMPDAAMAEFGFAGVVTAPVALLVTRLIDRYWLDCNPLPVKGGEAATVADGVPGRERAEGPPRGHVAGA